MGVFSSITPESYATPSKKHRTRPPAGTAKRFPAKPRRHRSKPSGQPPGNSNAPSRPTPTREFVDILSQKCYDIHQRIILFSPRGYSAFLSSPWSPSAMKRPARAFDHAEKKSRHEISLSQTKICAETGFQNRAEPDSDPSARRCDLFRSGTKTPDPFRIGKKTSSAGRS